MIILGFAITLLEIFATVVNTIVSRIIGKEPPTPALKKTTTKNYYYNNNKNNKRPNSLDLSPVYQPKKEEEEYIETMNYAAHLGPSRQMASESIAEYRISPEFFLDLQEDGATFTKEWSNFTQTCRIPMVEFIELLAFSPGILAFAEDMSDGIDENDDSLHHECLFLSSERAIFVTSKIVISKNKEKDPVRYTNLALKTVYRGSDKKTHGLSDNSVSFR